MRRSTIGERPKSRGELAAWYGAILEQQAESGLSVVDFAAEMGISAWTLYEWRRRLGAAAVVDDAGAAQPHLIEVAVAPAPHRAAAAFVVEVGAGRRITVPAGFDSRELQRLVGALESC